MTEQIKVNYALLGSFLDKLPEGIDVISAEANTRGAFVQLYGSFDLRAYAKANGASVEAKRTAPDCIQLTTRLYGCNVIKCLIAGEPKYEQEAARL